MKKKVLLSFLLITPFLFGCNNNQPSTSTSSITKFYLDDEYYTHKESYESIFIDVSSKEDLTDLTSSKKSFAIYVYSTTCTACQQFSPIVESYCRSKNLVFYRVLISISSQTETKISDIRYTPSVALYNSGDQVRYLDAISATDTQYYQSVDGFDSFFQSYVYLK